jgi:integrase
VTLLLDAWLRFRDERAVALCATTLSTDYAQVERWLERCPVQELELGREVLAWVLTQEPPKAALRVGMYVKSLYRWAASPDVALLAVNPVQSFRFPKKPQRDEEIVVIPKAELEVVLEALRQTREGAAQWDLWAQFMLQTGMRTGEVRALTAADVSGGKALVHRNYTLTHGIKDSTKTNKKRFVPLNEVARATLEKTGAQDGYYFPWNRRAFQSFFTERMQKLHSEGRISKRYRPYDLRHTAISGWLEAQVPVAQVASWAGNTAEVIWKHYANATESYEMPIL